MAEKVKIKVSGLMEQTDGERIVSECEGVMQYKEPYYYVSYEEKLDQESDEKSKTIIRFSEQQLRVTRKGQVESVLEFLEGASHNSVYMTSFGNFEVALSTRKLDIRLEEPFYHMNVEYQIGLNSMPMQDGSIEIHIQKM